MFSRSLVRHRWTLQRCFSSLPSGSEMLPLPALSPTMTNGNLANWNLEEGQEFEAGTVMCEIETDKATVDYEAVDDGVLAKILVKEGTKDLPVGTAIAVVAETKSIADQVAGMDLSFLTDSSTVTATPVDNAPVQETTSVQETTHNVSENPIVSPAASFLLNSYGVDAHTIKGSGSIPGGKHGVITKEDALKAIQGKSLAPVDESIVENKTPSLQQQQQQQHNPFTHKTTLDNTITRDNRKYEDIELTSMRKVIASRLTEAKQSRPHFYATIDCEIDNILAFRSKMKKQLGKAPSINDMIVRAAALSLRDVPRVNCRMEPDGEVVQNESIDVAVAVATKTGLITPIVKNTDQKGVLEISKEMKDLAGRARENKLKLEEFQGGSFAISNLGMLGISDFTAVISPPHSAILAVGTGRKEFKIVGPEETLQPVNMLTVQVSCDRRVVDDVTAGRFLACFQTYMSDPMMMSL